MKYKRAALAYSASAALWIGVLWAAVFWQPYFEKDVLSFAKVATLVIIGLLGTILVALWHE